MVKRTRYMVRFEEEGTRNFMYLVLENWIADGCPEVYWVEVTPE